MVNGCHSNQFDHSESFRDSIFIPVVYWLCPNLSDNFSADDIPYNRHVAFRERMRPYPIEALSSVDEFGLVLSEKTETGIPVSLVGGTMSLS